VKKFDEQIEFAISQYLDGTLTEDRRAEVEGLLADDAHLRGVLEEHRSLTELLRSDRVPEVRWEGLSKSISSAMDLELEERTRRASWWIRLRGPMSLAAAASVILVAGISLRYLLGPRPTPTPNPIVTPPQVNSLIVQGPQEDRPEGRQVAEISIGPGGSYAKESGLAPYMDEIDARPARVLMASGIAPEQPATAFPF